MSTTYNIEIREFNGTDYDILYPITTIENVNGLTTSLDELSTSINEKANVSDLGTLAGKDSISLSDDTTGKLPISKGGTNATDEVGARANLGLGSLATKSTVTLATDVTGTLPVGNGGTGNTNGTVEKLTTARTIRTNLASTATASFDGSANITPGVTGTLPVANGGTGQTSLANVKTWLGLGGIQVRPNYTIVTSDPGANSTLNNGTICFVI